MEEESEETEEGVNNHCKIINALSGISDNSKEVRINSCNYELSEVEITNWIKQYSVITSELEEIATTRGSGRVTIGTGSYILKVRLNRLIPNIIPMHGLKIKCFYQGVKKTM